MKVVLADVNPLSVTSSQGVLLPFLRDAGGGSVGTSSVFREPYGAEWVAAAAKAWAGARVEVLIQGADDPRTYAERILSYRPDVVALGIHASCLASEAYRVAHHLRATLPDATLVAGGYHPTGRPAEVLASGFDAIVVGEAEAAFAELCISIDEGRPWGDIRGIVTGEGDLQKRESRFGGIPLADYPWPVRSEEAIRISRCAPLSYPPPDEQAGAAQISYSRGCPYGCPFCQSEQVFGNTVRYRRPRDVVSEMRSIRDTFGASFFFFTDLTFNLNHDRTVELCEELVSAKLGVHWFAYASVDGLEPVLLSLMREAGCTRLGIGIESVIEETLSAAKCSLRYRSLDEIRRALQAVDDAGILTRGYLMAGWPWESHLSYEKTAEALRILPVDQLRVAFAVPFAGVKFAGEFDVVTDDPSRYTTNEPIFVNKELSPEEQQSLAQSLVEGHVNSEEFAAHVASKVARFPELRRSFEFYIRHLTERGILKDPGRFSKSESPWKGTSEYLSGTEPTRRG